MVFFLKKIVSIIVSISVYLSTLQSTIEKITSLKNLKKTRENQ
jgi:hypothetical protein